VAAGDHPDLRGAPAASRFPLRGTSGLGHTRQGVGPACTAPTEEAARKRFVGFAEAWGRKYPVIISLWESAWAELVPFPNFDIEIRRVVRTTDAIESINARIRRAVRARGHFPNESAALKCVYLAEMSLDPAGAGQKRRVNRWKAALNAFEITFDGRLSAGHK
jgi:transposase-like protein